MASRSSMAQQSSNPYASAQAHARKLNVGKPPGSAPAASAYPALSSSSDFPAPPTAKSKRANVATAFAPKKPPPMNNVMQFPPPSSTAAKPTPRSLEQGKQTIESLKSILGTAQYKKLKSFTKGFATGTSPPEQYIEDAASLFDNGIRDRSFWEHIPLLINDMPDRGIVDRAMRHLESLRMVNEMQEMEFGGGGGSTRGAAKKPINYVLPAKKKGSSWGNNGGNNKSSGQSATMKLGGNTPVASSNIASKQNGSKKSNTNGGATSENSNGAGKKSKAKKKNNELKSLAFGV